MSGRKVPKELEKEIEHRYSNLKQSETFIGKELGYGRDAIYGALKRLKVKKRNHREAAGGLNEKEIDKLVELYKKNEELTMADMARKFNIANGTVKAYLDLRKVDIREKGIPKELHKQILERFNKCEKISHISRDLGFSTKSINRVLKANNVITGTLTERFGAQIKKDYENGISAREIAEKLNRTEGGILNVLDELKIKRRSNSEAHGGMSHGLDDEVKRLYTDELLDMRSIGRKFGFSKTSIKKSLLRSGISIRSNSEAQRIIQHLKGWDSLEDLLSNKQRYEESCYVYLFHVKNYPDYCKPGISNDYLQRALDEPKLYGDFEEAWPFETRREARFCELAILQGTVHLEQCPTELISIGGAYEIRKSTALKIKPFMMEIIDDFNFSKDNGISIYEWALENIDMTNDLYERYKERINN